MSARRGTSNTNARGSSSDRRIRKQFLLDKFGDGTTCQCSTCPAILGIDTVTVDRYPVAGVDGGTYRRGNIRPQCMPCASSQGGKMSAQRRPLKVGQLVRFRKGGKVYRVHSVLSQASCVILDRADHPDGTRRVPRGWHPVDRLIRVPA